MLFEFKCEDEYDMSLNVESKENKTINYVNVVRELVSQVMVDEVEPCMLYLASSSVFDAV